MSKTNNQFVLCVNNQGCDDLELRKIYTTISDEKAEKDGYIRIVDESGEDYLYPASFFVSVELPQEAVNALEAVI